MPGRLSGKVAVVTGASSGIGAAVAAALAKEGAHVALAARRIDALEAVKASIISSRASGVNGGGHETGVDETGNRVMEAGNGSGSGSNSHGGAGKILIHRTDVAQKSDVDALFATVTSHLGPVDILICCAGVMYYTLMSNAHALSHQSDQMINVNCKGVLHCLAAATPAMLHRKQGHIVAVSSDAGRKVFPGLGVYSATKFFVEAALQTLRLETAGSGLRVTSVQPGNVETALLDMSTDHEALTKYGARTGAKILDPEDVAQAIVYAVCAPEHVGVNEILIEPRDEPI